jgi:hypothetical protein
LRKSPYLTEEQKADRYNWCVGNKNNDFADFVFTDESSVWVNQLPLYHMRMAGTHSQCLESRSNSRIKLNVFGGISVRGPTNFQVMI